MDYNITADKIRGKITKKTAAIIVPHMFGVPASMDRIVALGIPVIEDITLSLGASLKGRLAGTWGKVSICSFHASKMIACGEGGILTASNLELLNKARYLNGWENEQVSLRVKTEDLPEYELQYNFHLSDIAAALGISQLRKLPRFISRRQELAQRYTEKLYGLPGLCCPIVKRPNIFFRYLVAIEAGDPISIIKKFTDAGIEAGRGVYPPLHRFLKEPNNWYPSAERAVDTLVSIPLYPALAKDEADYVLDVCGTVFRDLQSK
jgi:dTDP-4-amino-4,6-dideoxygalactose transaminase